MPFEQEDVARSECLGAARGCASPGGLGHRGGKFYLYRVSFLIVFVGGTQQGGDFLCIRPSDFGF